MKASSILVTLSLWLVAGTAFGGTPVQLAEPGVLELLAISGVVGVAIAIRKRRK